MRAVYLVPLCVASMMFWTVGTFGDTHPPVGPSTGMGSRPADNVQEAATQPAGLTCVQNALGGVRAFANVSSLRITASTKPVAVNGPQPGTREIHVILPDRYRLVDLGQPPVPGAGPLRGTIGFDGRVVLSSPRRPDSEVALRDAQQNFARQMLMRFPRSLGGIVLSERTATESGQKRLVLDASVLGRVEATLLVDSNTCVPVALLHEGVNPFMGPVTIRVALSDYRTFGGVRFPMALKTSHNGKPISEESVAQVEVNAPGADQYFPAAQR